MRCAASAISEPRIGWLVVAAALTCGCGGPAPVAQPIDFSHQLHVKAEIECSTCHEKVADTPYATLPPLRVCAKCHKELQGKDAAREQPILDAVKQKHELKWQQVNRLPGHVYFSHRAHVGFAEMECPVCHGDVKSKDHPFTTPNIEGLSMHACISCHQQKGASTDCLACHK
jgi:hypothetical protein